MAAEKRTAMFKACLAFYRPHSQRACVFYGSLSGFIAYKKKGDLGFGYDPVFLLPPSGKHLAELSTEDKNRISHRGRALSSFRRLLNDDLQ